LLTEVPVETRVELFRLICLQRAFEAPALSYVRRALFRPARVMGRSVRVLVRLPIDFRITR